MHGPPDADVGTRAGAGADAPRPTPFEGLDPDTVLDALDAVGLVGDGRLIQLNSYENRVFQAYLDDGRIVVAKFYRPGRWTDAQLLEEHAFATELVADEIPVAAPWLLKADPRSSRVARLTPIGPTLAVMTSAAGCWRFGVSARVPGRAPELEHDGTLERIGRFVGRIHAVGARSGFQHRPELTPLSFGRFDRDWLLAEGIVPPDARHAWERVSGEALAAINAAWSAGPAPRTIRLHGDCHLGNILWGPDGPNFVDLDDAVGGPAVQDLWMLLSGERDGMCRQLASVLDGYRRFMDLDPRELRLIEALRTLRILRHSAWIARRWTDPAFPIAFPWFESPKYWSEQTTRLEQQLDAMAEPPLGA